MIFPLIERYKFLKIFLAVLVIAGFVIVLYGSHFDIRLTGYDNLELYRGAKERNTLGKIFDFSYFSKGGDPPSAYYNPVILLVWRFMVNNFDKDASPYHLLCISLHLINALIVFFLFRKLFKNNFFSFLAALSFAVFYQNFESVSWIAAGIATGLTTFFILSTLFLAIQYFKTNNKLFFIFSLLTFFIGTFTKEYAVFAFPMVASYYLLLQRKWELKLIKKDLFLLPYLILSLPIVLITLLRLESSAVVTKWGGTNFGVHMVYRSFDFLNYLITVIPVSFGFKMMVAILILMAIPVLIYFRLKDKRLLFFMAWLCCSIAPFIYSNFRNIYTLGRYLYLPSVAWFGLLYYIALSIKSKKIRIGATLGLIGYTILFNLSLIL